MPIVNRQDSIRLQIGALNLQDLACRMKRYEAAAQSVLTQRTPVIIRLDGKAFHTYTRNAEKPFDVRLQSCLGFATEILCSQIQGAKLAYIQSDEVSILLTDYDKLDTQSWFDYNVQKLASVSASLFTAHFNYQMDNGFYHTFSGPAIFDARAFNIPVDDVDNYFLWRQRDWERNSLSMLARAHFSHKELVGKDRHSMHDMLHSVGVNWNDLPTRFKRGICVKRDEDGAWNADYEIPIFSQDRGYITELLIPKEV